MRVKERSTIQPTTSGLSDYQLAQSRCTVAKWRRWSSLLGRIMDVVLP